MPDPDREARRAAALRANLRRRKAGTAEPPPPDPVPPQVEPSATE